MGNETSRVFSYSKQETEICWQRQNVASSVYYLGMTKLFPADSDYLCPKTPPVFWPIPFFSVAFVSTTRSGPRQRVK